MPRIIQPASGAYLDQSLSLVQEVFTEHSDAKEGLLVRRLVGEIRSGRFYLPQLDLIALDETGKLAGLALFSRFHLEGRYSDRLLLLSPVAVRTDLQRRHISRDMIEYGFDRARELGFDAVIVEGNPANYRSRGFVTAAEHGVLPGKTVHLPHIDCLMIKALREGALTSIHGVVEYTDYPVLLEE